MVNLKGNGFVLRKMRMSDKQSIAKYANNKKIHINTLILPYPYTVKNAEEWIKQNQKDYRKKNKTDFVFAIEVDGEMVGTIGIHHIVQGHKAEIGYWLGETHWGKGIMTSAVKLAVNYAFKEFKLKRIHAEVFSFNKGSVRVLEKNGFEFEGISKKAIKKNGKFLDGLNYAKVK